MADKSWYVSKDGTQLPGELDTAAVKALLAAEPGKAVLVWAPGMANWALPATLPDFAPEPAPAAAPAVPRPAPAPRAAAPRMAMPAGVPDKAQLQEQAGVFKSLLDFSFEQYVTPKLVRAVYMVITVLMALAVVLGVLGGLFSGLAAMRMSFISGLVTIIVSVVIVPIAAVIYLSMARIFLETVTVLFKLKDDVHKIAERKD
jgi:hypothetical protein